MAEILFIQAKGKLIALMTTTGKKVVEYEGYKLERQHKGNKYLYMLSRNGTNLDSWYGAIDSEIK